MIPARRDINNASSSAKTGSSFITENTYAGARTKVFFQIQRKMTETSQVYPIKIIRYQGKRVPILLQNENGPCPLLAICTSAQFSSHV